MGMRLPRASGILLHPTSLPSQFGIGDLGPEAEAFVEFLAETGQRWWQILPLGPTGYGNSPYQSHSSFAGNPLLISPELLAADGWLSPEDWRDAPAFPDGDVDFDAVVAFKTHLLRLAFERFPDDDAGLASFVEAHREWLDDFALFMALKAQHGGLSWTEWPPELATRQADALRDWRNPLAKEIRFHEFVQYEFALQWERLRRISRDRQIGFIGDLPIFVALDSADVWARPDLFELDPERRPTVVAGVPPDYFSETGQLWGNPLYRWEAHGAERYLWWINRLKATTDRVDLVRLDHFRGFEAYWEVPAGSETAANGRWVRGPGAAFLEAVRDALGHLPLLAEDLGVITPDVEALRDRFHLPGMRVLQFAFGDDAKAHDYLPYSYINHCLVYTGTHDNDTTVGWFKGSAGHTTQPPEVKAAEREFVLRYVGTTGEEIHWDMIRLALGSVADTAIIPLQDVLGLDSASRMNVPGRPTGNWHWRFLRGQPDTRTRDRLADLTAVYSRWNGPLPEHLHRCPPQPKREEAEVSV
jgi:4-alpha-glucanotransferase